MAAPAKRIIVCGGNGFVGSRVCKYAVARGWDVMSISRSGEPKWETVTESSTPPSWAHRVTWERANLLRPETYVSLLKGADAVVHSMGILLEADYKGVLRGQESPIAGLQRAFSQSGPPPAAAREQLTYETMNRDSAIALAKAAAPSASTFVYLSAAGGAPVLPSRYLSTKREAESTIASLFPGLRGIFIRAPFMYDSSRPLTMPLAALTGAGALFNRATGGILDSFMGAGGAKPLKVDVVAESIVEAIEDETVRGPVEVKQIEELAEKAWRKGML
ncbi:hypothetical protein BX600DRAFT_433313 [Xylariales sp. PMI_506]|nr:hypothetical protein BX600DRAFT_433313 [Xylariales sp. PMI_506]